MERNDSFILDAPTLLVLEELPASGALTTGSRNRQESTLSTLTCCARESTVLHRIEKELTYLDLQTSLLALWICGGRDFTLEQTPELAR